MLDTPKYGWSHVSIGSWSDRCSYLDDVPMELLKASEAVPDDAPPDTCEIRRGGL